VNTIAIIPARGGSKRIPKKNIRPFLGKPIIAYSIEAALKSGLFDDVIVSTEDEEIANTSEHFGASVPFYRPIEYANDSLGVIAVVSQTLTQLVEQGHSPSEVCMIYATAPMILISDLVDSYRKFSSTEKSFVFSAAQFGSPVFRAFTISSDGSASMLNPDYFDSRSQDLPVAYYDAAHFIWGKPEAFKNSKSVLFSEISLPYIIPNLRAVDIDTLEDWQRAELLYQVNFQVDEAINESSNSC